MPPYYNIHTHKPTVHDTESIAIQSLYEDFHLMDLENKYSIGLHPAYLHNHEEQFKIIRQLARNTNVLAIGECGLDKLVHTPMPVQIAIFTQHIQLANELQKPLVIHCVQAHEELLKVFSQHPPQVPVIIHGYNKRNTIADKLIVHGYYLSFGAALLRADAPAAEVLQYIGAGRFFLETDDADVLIEDIYAKAAQIRNTTVESLILQIADNYKTVFTP